MLLLLFLNCGVLGKSTQTDSLKTPIVHWKKIKQYWHYYASTRLEYVRMINNHFVTILLCKQVSKCLLIIMIIMQIDNHEIFWFDCLATARSRCDALVIIMHYCACRVARSSTRAQRLSARSHRFSPRAPR
jgi:hypothetical protein